MGPWGFWALVIELLLWRLVCFVPQTQAHTQLHLQDFHTLFHFISVCSSLPMHTFTSIHAHTHMFCSSQELVEWMSFMLKEKSPVIVLLKNGVCLFCTLFSTLCVCSFTVCPLNHSKDQYTSLLPCASPTISIAVASMDTFWMLWFFNSKELLYSFCFLSGPDMEKNMHHVHKKKTSEYWLPKNVWYC